MEKKVYIKEREKKIEQLLRLYLGVQQLIYHPLKNIGIIALVVLFVIVWKHKDALFNFTYVPTILVPILELFVPISLVLILVIFIMIYIKGVGSSAAKNDEAKLYVVFNASDIKPQSPILISHKKMRDTNVTIREFYTPYISKKRWEEQKDELADCLNVTLVYPYIEYGGKQRNKGNRIIIYSVPNRKLAQRGELYDEEF